MMVTRTTMEARQLETKENDVKWSSIRLSREAYRQAAIFYLVPINGFSLLASVKAFGYV
jgi:hypothetical protein